MAGFLLSGYSRFLAMKFQKPALTFHQQVELLRSRGLIVADDRRALRWLSRVSYYRLSSYFLRFKIADGDDFSPGTTLNQIPELYKFDARLRVLVMQALERVEIACRTSITYHIAHAHGPFGHTDKNSYSSWFIEPRPPRRFSGFEELMADIDKEERRTR